MAELPPIGVPLGTSPCLNTCPMANGRLLPPTVLVREKLVISAGVTFPEYVSSDVLPVIANEPVVAPRMYFCFDRFELNPDHEKTPLVACISRCLALMRSALYPAHE